MFDEIRIEVKSYLETFNLTKEQIQAIMHIISFEENLPGVYDLIKEESNPNDLVMYEEDLSCIDMLVELLEESDNEDSFLASFDCYKGNEICIGEDFGDSLLHITA